MSEPICFEIKYSLLLDTLRLEGGESAEQVPIIIVDGCDDGKVAEAVEDVEAQHLSDLGFVKPSLRNGKVGIIFHDVDFSLVEKKIITGIE